MAKKSSLLIYEADNADRRGSSTVVAGAFSDSLRSGSASPRLYQCGTVDLALKTRPGTSLSAKVTLGGYTAVVSATRRSSNRYPDLFTDLTLTVSQSGRTLFARSFNGDQNLGTVLRLPTGLEQSEEVCIAQFAGSSAPAVLLNLYTGGAHCCTIARGFPLTSENTSGAYAEMDFGNPGVTLAVESGHVVILTALNSFAYAFTDFAGSALPIRVVEFRNGEFLTTTRDYPALVAKDAASWLHRYKQAPSNLSLLAAWVADSDLLGQGSSAWRYVDELQSEGKLVAQTSWPSGAAFVRKLSDLLVKLGYQQSATTQPLPSSSTTAALARVLICSGSPMYEPGSLHWCTSYCSSYVDDLTWTSWTRKSATGTGILMTNNGIPSCSHGTWTAHPGYKVTLSHPEDVSYCTDSGEASGVLFTSSNLFGPSLLPAVTPPCP